MLSKMFKNQHEKFEIDTIILTWLNQWPSFNLQTDLPTLSKEKHHVKSIYPEQGYVKYAWKQRYILPTSSSYHMKNDSFPIHTVSGTAVCQITLPSHTHSLTPYIHTHSLTHTPHTHTLAHTLNTHKITPFTNLPPLFHIRTCYILKYRISYIF